ncbi:MAG: recombinase family protein [Deltaproteobacteria bacterium]|nr:recombinase family protein [Deltaproteobacteria bacterium]
MSAKNGSRCCYGISYGRVSTVGQLVNSDGSRREDASPEAQRARCQEHARYLSQRKGVEHKIVEHISDDGFSAKNANRPGYQRMWDLVASGSIDFILASELSRLNRSVHDFLDLVDHCKKHEVNLIIIGLELDTSTPFGNVIVVILVALAQFEREMTSMRVRENALTRLISDGKINGGGEILGLDRDSARPGHFKKNEEELERVRKLLRLFLTVSSKRKLLQEACKRGITGKHGKELKQHALDIMFENLSWRYRGLWEANRENKDKDAETLPENKRYQIVNLPHGALLEEDLLDQVQEKLADTYKKKKKSCVDNHTYLLSGILFFEDGTRFSGQPAKERQYRYYYNKENKVRIDCSRLERHVKALVRENFSSIERFQRMVEDGIRRLHSDVPKIEARIRILNTRMDGIEGEDRELQQSFDASKLSDPTYASWLKERIKTIGQRREEARTELAILEKNRIEITKKRGFRSLQNEVQFYLGVGFENLSGVQQREIIQRIVHSITVRKNNEIQIKMYGEPKKKQRVTSEAKSSGNEWDGGRGKSEYRIYINIIMLLYQSSNLKYQIGTSKSSLECFPKFPDNKIGE